MKKEEMKKLSEEIHAFLDKYACMVPDYDSEHDEKIESYASPDASQMFATAEILKAGVVPEHMPWSSWGSGGYSPYTSKEGKTEHERLLSEIRKSQLKICSKCSKELLSSYSF